MSKPIKLIEELNRMVNAQYETPEFRHFLSVPLTRERARFFTVEGAHYIKNRRDCWGYVQGGAPLDVKSIIWKHEEDELINDPRCNTDHYTLTVRTAESLGLTREDIERATPRSTRGYFSRKIGRGSRRLPRRQFSSGGTTARSSAAAASRRGSEKNGMKS
jgi:hypothetical protein